MTNCTSTMSRPTFAQAQAMIADGVRMLLKGAGLFVIALVDSLVDRAESRRAHQTLAKMDERMLKDIGISRSDVERFRLKDDRNRRSL